MNRTIFLLAVSLTLPTAQGFAREPQAPPSPSDGAVARVGATGKGSDGKSLFVGRYGETIAFPDHWTADAEMRDSTEVVYFHRKSHDEFGYKPFNLKRSDYKFDNFAPMGLIELVVIPKNAPGGLRSLKAIRLAKESELKRNGSAYEISDVINERWWPLGTFDIAIERPYRIVQTYAESPKEFYILTRGGNIETGEFGLSQDRVRDYGSAENEVRTSLGEYLVAARRKTLIGTLFHVEAKTPEDLLNPFKVLLRTKDTLTERNDMELVRPGYGEDNEFLPKIMVVASIALLVLSAWPGKSARVRRARLFGRSMLLFAYFTGLAGFLTVYIPARFGNATWKSDEVAALIPMLFIPIISWAAARQFGSAHTKRVFITAGLLAAIWMTLILWGSNFNNTDHPRETAFENTLALLIVGMTFGIAFSLAFGPLPRKEKAAR